MDLGHHGKLLRFGRRTYPGETRRTENLRDTMGKRRGVRGEERDTSKDEIALEIFLHWFLCGKPVISIPLKRRSIESPPELSVYSTVTFSNFVTAEGRSPVDITHDYSSF